VSALSLSAVSLSALPALVLFVALGGTPGAAPADVPAEVEVAPGETLARVAARTLGDARAATELRALNALPEGEVRPGTRLKLPGPDRARAQSALSAARAAITQRTGAQQPGPQQPGAQRAGARRDAGHDAGGSAEALARLEAAERLFREARYEEAAREADAAWALVSDPSGPVRFSVSVSADGRTTEVESRTGAPVRVEAQGVTRAVPAGQRVRVARGQPPPAPAPAAPPEPLPTPRPLSPAVAAVLQRPAAGSGLAPVTVRWAAVTGAEAYTVEVASEGGRSWTVEARGTVAALPSLPAGQYRWRVWAHQGRRRSEASPARPFTLEEERLELDVQGSTWK
jgi:hypothetical protein